MAFWVHRVLVTMYYYDMMIHRTLCNGNYLVPSSIDSRFAFRLVLLYRP